MSKYWVCQDLVNMKKCQTGENVLECVRVISYWLVTSHEVAGSEAEVSASSVRMTNVPYLKRKNV